MHHRFIIAPDPANPDRYYAEHLITGERFTVNGPRITTDELRTIVDPYRQLTLPEGKLALVEHPTHESLDVHAQKDGKPVCLEPGCLTPAPLYCEQHRYQMTASDF